MSLQQRSSLKKETEEKWKSVEDMVNVVNRWASEFQHPCTTSLFLSFLAQRASDHLHVATSLPNQSLSFRRPYEPSRSPLHGNVES